MSNVLEYYATRVSEVTVTLKFCKSQSIIRSKSLQRNVKCQFQEYCGFHAFDSGRGRFVRTSSWRSDGEIPNRRVPEVAVIHSDE